MKLHTAFLSSVALAGALLAQTLRSADQDCGTQTPWATVGSGVAAGAGNSPEESEHDALKKLTGAADCAAQCDDGEGGFARCEQRLNGQFGTGGGMVTFPVPQPFPAPPLWITIATAGVGAKYRSTCAECE